MNIMRIGIGISAYICNLLGLLSSCFYANKSVSQVYLNEIFLNHSHDQRIHHIEQKSRHFPAGSYFGRREVIHRGGEQ